MKVATIGTGFIVDWFLSAVKQNEGVQCVAMYSRSKESAAGLAKKYEIEDIYTELDEMLARDDIDFVYVASPNSLHFSHSYKVLQAGKNVICEKPFTSTVQEFDTLATYAKEHQLYIFEAIVTAHMPNYLTLKENLDRIGQIRMVQCNFSQYSSRYDKFLEGEQPNVFNPAFSGGALADINIYNLHFVIGLFGKPQDVHYYPNIQRGIDTSGVAILEYPGFKAVCVGCKDSKSHNLAQVQGEVGYITVDSETSKCSTVIVNVGTLNDDLSVEENDIALYYEVGVFNDIFKRKDLEECYRKLDYSRSVMEVYQALRKDGGIVFTADEA